MKRRLAVVLVSLAALSVGTALAYDVNKDLVNLGSISVYDVTVVLTDVENVTGTYTGDFHTATPSTQVVGGASRTVISFSNYQGTNAAVPPGQKVHIGWSTSDHSSNIRDMYWTLLDGSRAGLSVVYNITNGYSYPGTHQIVLQWVHEMVPAIAAPVRARISNVRYRFFGTAVPLDNLNAANPNLADGNMNLLDAGPIDINAGVLAERSIGVAPSGPFVVVKYDVTQPDGLSDGSSTDYVQFQLWLVPTLSEWGTVAVVVLLLGTGAWLIYRRRVMTQA